MESAHANRRIIVMELRTSPFVSTARATSVNAHRARNIRCNYGAGTARNPAEDERKRTNPGHFCEFLFEPRVSGRIRCAMVTDAPPRKKKRLLCTESDRLNTLRLPQYERLRRIATAIDAAMKTGRTKEVLRVSAEFLDTAADFYQVKHCGVRVPAARPLGVRERATSELFGDSNPNTSLIRVWMKTAIRKEVTSFGTILSALCHEFCHRLDSQRLPNSWHTRGFYERAASLCHRARGTPPKRLVRILIPGRRWRIDWQPQGTTSALL